MGRECMLPCRGLMCAVLCLGDGTEMLKVVSSSRDDRPRRASHVPSDADSAGHGSDRTTPPVTLGPGQPHPARTPTMPFVKMSESRTLVKTVPTHLSSK